MDEVSIDEYATRIDQELTVDIGRCDAGDTFLDMVHRPTGIARFAKVGKGESQSFVSVRLLNDICRELRSLGYNPKVPGE